MVIGFDASRAFVGERTGTENYSYHLLKALAKIDQKNTYRIYIKKLASKGETFRGWPENFTFRVVNWPRFWTQGGLALECLVNPPDVLFIPAHTLPVIHRRRLKTVVTIHDLGAEYLPQYHQTPQKYYLNWSTMYAVKHATQVIAVSENTKKDLVSKLQCDIEIIRMIYEGVEPLKFEIRISKSETEKILRKYDIEKPYILFVGTIQPRKNLVRLIEAFSIVLKTIENRKIENSILKVEGRSSKKIPSSSFDPQKSIFSSLSSIVNLILVGKPGWLYEEIYGAPKRYGVGDRVKFLNFVNDNELQVLYKKASVFCLPSLYEGFGLPFLEAMAAGVPVVASNTSSLPEIVGEAGVFVDPYNSSDIADGLRKVLTDEKLRRTLIAKGKEQVKKFTWEKTAQETLNVLEEACSSNN